MCFFYHPVITCTTVYPSAPRFHPKPIFAKDEDGKEKLCACNVDGCRCQVMTMYGICSLVSPSALPLYRPDVDQCCNVAVQAGLTRLIPQSVDILVLSTP